MKAKHFITTIALSLLSLAAAHAATPANDSILNATLVTAPTVTFTQQAGPTATAEKGEPAHAGLPAKNTVWYRIIMPFQGEVGVVLPAGSPARKEIYKASGLGRSFGELGGFGGAASGEVIMVAVDSPVPVTVTLLCRKSATDDIRMAPPLSLGGINAVAISSLTADATDDTLQVGSQSAWVKFQTSQTQVVLDTVGSFANGQEISTRLAVYSGTPGGELIQEATSTSLAGTLARVCVLQNINPAKTYYVGFGGTGASTTGALRLNSNTPASGNVLSFETLGQDSVLENDGSFTFHVRRSGITGTVGVQVITVNGSAIGGSDFTALNQTLSFLPGELVKAISIPITSDGVADDNESFTIRLQNPTGGASVEFLSERMITISDGSGNNCKIGFAETSIAAVEGSTVPLTLVRKGNVSQNVAAYIDGPFDGAPAPVSFSPGQSMQIVSVRMSDDHRFTGDRGTSITLNNPQGSGATVSAQSLVVNLTEDDAWVPTTARYRVLADSSNGSDLGQDDDLVELNVTSTGSFTGKLSMANASWPLKAQFDVSGKCRLLFQRRQSGPVQLEMQIKDAMGQLEVTVTELAYDRSKRGDNYPLPTHSVSSPHPAAGRYTSIGDTMGLQGNPRSLFFTSAVSATGALTCAGYTADNKAFTSTLPIDGDSFGLMYLVRPANGGYIAGYVNYAASVSNATTDPMRWMKPLSVKDALIAEGLDKYFNVDTSRYVPPATGQPALPIFAKGMTCTAQFSMGDAFPAGKTWTLNLPTSANVLVPSAPGLSLSVQSATGAITGSVLGTNGKQHTVRGVIFPADSRAYGNLFGASNSSDMTLF